jgi:hypothetical protein
MCQLFNSDPPFHQIDDFQSWEQLAAVCGFDANQEQEKLFSMLWAMDAPENLQNFQLALESMRVLLVYLDKLQGTVGQDKACWEQLTGQVLTRLKSLSEEQMVNLSLPEVKHDRTQGVLTPHPWYGLLLFVQDFTNQTAVMGMMARVMKLMWVRGDEDSDSTRYRLSLAIRVVFGELGELCEETSILDFSDMEIVKYLDDILDQNISVDQIHVMFLRRYFLGEIERRDNVEKTGGYTRRAINCFGIRGHPRKAERRPTSLLRTDHRGLAEPEEESPGTEKVEQVSFPYTGKKARELNNQGIWIRDCATDLLKIQERIGSNTNAHIMGDPVRKQFQKKQIAAEISRNAQPVPYLWAILTSWEVLLVLKTLPSLAKSDPDLALILLICLVRGVDIEEALKIRYRDQELTEKNVYFEVDEAGVCAWWLPVNIGIKPGKGTAGCVGYGHPPKTHFKVVFSPVLDRLFKEYLSPELRWGREAGARLTLLTGVKQVTDMLVDWISKTNRQYRTRLTLLRISRFLALRGRARQGLDAVQLAYLRGKYELDSETQVYYTRTTPGAVESAYHDFWSSVFDEIHHEWRMLNDPVPAWLNGSELVAGRQLELPVGEEIESHLGENGFGAHKIPEKKTVKDMVRHIDKALERAGNRLPVFRRTIEYHNQYMLYTLTYLTWASGYRAVSSPLPDPRLLDQQTGLLHISDKDAEDGYCSRLVCLTADCVRQIQYYLEHLEAVSLRVAGYNPKTYSAFRQAFLRWSKRPPAIGNKRWIIETDEGAFTPFVMLDEKGFTPIRPKLVRQLLPPGYQLPLDSNRHYLRSWLLNKGCDPSLIDVQMGHWHHGHEPWGKASSLAPGSYGAHIKPYMEALLKDLGFASRPSRECV